MDIGLDVQRYIKENRDTIDLGWEDDGKYTAWGVHDMPHTEETKRKISLAGMGNTNKKGKTGYKLSDDYKEKKRLWMLIEGNNPMDNEESRNKIRTSALKKVPCPKCGWLMNKGNLSRHKC